MSPRRCWFLLQSGPGPSSENMAWDEGLLEAVSALGAPVLRWYGWTEPAASFGYFQKISAVKEMTLLRPLIRRPTGGGLVPHDADWTYSLVFPPGEPWYGVTAVESYRRVHQWIQAAFEQAGLATELSAGGRREGDGQCFVGAEQFDVVRHGRKIAGAAQRRTRGGLLIQGSIQPPAGIHREAFEKAFCAVASAQWDVEWKPLEVNVTLNRRVAELVRLKYSRQDYNERR
jgi:lipoate-protein ligase A